MPTPERRPPVRPPAASAVTQIDFRQAFLVIRSHLWVALALALVVCSLLAWQQLRRPKQYAAQAILMMERVDRILDIKQVVDSGMDDPMFNTRLEQMRSIEVVRRVVATLTPGERRLVLGPLGEGATGEQMQRRLEMVVRAAVQPSRMPRSVLIALRVVHRDPEAAALLANRFAEEFIRHLMERNAASNAAALAFLDEQAGSLRQSVESAERDLQRYRERYNLVSLEDNQNIVVDRLKSLNTSATAARVARLNAEVRLAQAEIVLAGNAEPVELAALAESPALYDIQSRIDDLKARHAVMAERYGRRHPQMLQNAREVEALEKLRASHIDSAINNLRIRRDKAVAEEQQLLGQLAMAERESLQLDEIGVEYNVLRRALDTKKSMYTQILNRLNEARISAQLESVNVKISDFARAPSAPFAPNPRKTLMMVALLGLGILVGYPFIVELFFARIRSWSDVEHYLGATLLGEIGMLRRMAEPDRASLVKAERDETGMEQFRALHSQIHISSRIDTPKTILVTSTAPGEGKSFIASNLASSFASHGKRVLLIDADLRRPSQHRNHSVDNSAGILRWIEEGGKVGEGVERDPRLGLVEMHKGLHLLRAGGTSRRASELVDSGRIPELIGALKRRFDIVVIDTPPAGVFSDALSFARLSDELVYVCRFNAVSRQQVSAALERLRQTDMEILGVVLNAMPGGRGGSYYYRSYAPGDYARYYERKPG